jgi:hypothetical protein
MTRRDRAAAGALDMTEHLTKDYRAISGLDAPVASPHSSEGSYTPPDPRLVEQVEMVNSGASTPNRAFPGEEDFSVVSVEQELLLPRAVVSPPSPSADNRLIVRERLTFGPPTITKAAKLRKFGKIAHYPESLHASFERI